jgi:hypothetical protein
LSAKANCTLGQGDVARASGDDDSARAQFREALALYESVHRTDNIALVHERLAGVTAGEERAAHVAVAREAWLAIGLPDQVARLDREFG